MRVDARGSGKSPGRSDPSSYQEAVDFYDAIEWIARRDWCSGSIGTLGISYHANCQWRVANLQPPSLKAIIPWEGRADLSIAIRPFMAASLRWGSSTPGSPPTWRTI